MNALTDEQLQVTGDKLSSRFQRTSRCQDSERNVFRPFFQRRASQLNSSVIVSHIPVTTPLATRMDTHLTAGSTPATSTTHEARNTSEGPPTKPAFLVVLSRVRR